MGDMRAMTAVAGSQAALLELSHVGKVYGGKGFVTTALDDVSLVVRKGEFVAIMGPSGSGKSTLLNCVATIDSVTSGHITLGGRDVTRLRRGDVAKFRRYELGFVFQDSNLLDTRSGKLGRRSDPMRVLVLQGSPNAGGSTALLAREFARGARESGHDVEVVDVADVDMAPCTGCVACGYGGTCALSDGFDAIREKVLAADMLVLATPLYYYGMTAQLKAVIDRFCSASPSIMGKRMRSALLAVAWNDDDWTFDALEAHYDTLVRYLCLRDCGRVLGGGCGTPDMTARTGFPKMAYELGRGL